MTQEKFNEIMQCRNLLEWKLKKIGLSVWEIIDDISEDIIIIFNEINCNEFEELVAIYENSSNKKKAWITNAFRKYIINSLNIGLLKEA